MNPVRAMVRCQEIDSDIELGTNVIDSHCLIRLHGDKLLTISYQLSPNKLLLISPDIVTDIESKWQKCVLHQGTEVARRTRASRPIRSESDDHSQLRTPSLETPSQRGILEATVTESTYHSSFASRRVLSFQRLTKPSPRIRARKPKTLIDQEALATDLASLLYLWLRSHVQPSGAGNQLLILIGSQASRG
ncbi:hypothetical protein BDW74DRAFT_93068 [Aspergillus multicolor]|uniref:uncharacterized protein n=1 Tax=Aspergillus multicolor TaxID=41759 RepID=UPI003CCDFEB6